MGLRVWLPLNGDLHNQGLDDVTVIHNGATIDNNGKIGKCYSFDGSQYMSVQLPNLTNYSTTECSMCVWVKFPNYSSGNKQILNIGTSSGWTNIRFGILYTYGSPQVITSISDGSSSVKYSCNAVITENDWNHVAVVFSERALKLYINGVLAKTYSTTYDISFDGITSLGIGAAPNGAEKFTGSINDVRIYDHALSPREIKEISKGLVCHYTLSGGGGENLLHGTNQGITNWTRVSSVKTMTIEATNDNLGVKTTLTQGTGGWALLFYNDAVMTETLATAGKEYTLSFDYTCTETGHFYCSYKKTSGREIQIWNNVWVDITKTNQWNHCSISDTTTGVAANGQGIYIDIRSLPDQSTFQIKNLKIESGSIATPWTPNPEDPEYTKMGFDDGIEYDVSGYGYNGTKTGTITHDVDTPRYWTSSYFNGSSYISTEAGSFGWFNFNQCTISAWMKPTSKPSSYSGAIGLSHDYTNNNKQFSIANHAGIFVAYYNNGSYSNVSSGYELPLNEWHHCVAVLDGTTVKLYVDGILKKTQTIDWGSAAVASTGRIQVGVDFPGTDEKYTGYYSDARIYMTPLSEADILALYNTPISLSSNGTLLTQGELTEV